MDSDEIEELDVTPAAVERASRIPKADGLAAAARILARELGSEVEGFSEEEDHRIVAAYQSQQLAKKRAKTNGGADHVVSRQQAEAALERIRAFGGSIFEELAEHIGKYGDEYSPTLRLEAAMAFITDGTARTPEELRNNPKFAKVPLEVLHGWARADGWDRRRVRFMRQWADQARKALGSRLNQLRLESLEQLEEIQTLAMGKLRSEELLPKSWEGVAGVVVQLNKSIERTRAAVARDLLPTEVEDEKVIEATVTKEEAEAVAKALLDARKNALREKRGNERVQIPTTADPAGPYLSPGADDEVDDD